ncbi:Eaa1 [Klebsiella pneumoniae subsp. rhinoscleromatis]|nr:Eaa1 [Klebsiella pneumoniae subsp. rhinoscleromatis]
MTKSTITRERAQQIFLGNGPEPSASEERELARMALAAMDSEPVAVIDQANLDYLLSGADADVWPPEREEIGDVLLYRHAQPVPVVPEEWTIADAVKFCKETGRQDAGAAMDAWNACRAAMLAAAPQSPGSEPATVPGKWIPVSERMPEDEQEVLTINKIGHRFVSFFDKHSGLFFDRLDAPAACCIEHVLVTHWMPLPAAPQEVGDA